MERSPDTYVVTGSAGFLGNNLIRLINEREPGARIVAICLPGESRRPLDGLRCEIRDGDVTRPETLEAALDPGAAGRGAVYIVHCAGVIEIGSRLNPAVESVNVAGVSNMIQATRDLAARRPDLHVRFLYVGSVHAIPPKPASEAMSEIDHFDPALVDGQYAKSKASASQLVLDAAKDGLDAVILQPSGIIGPYNFSPENMKELVRRVSRGKLRVCVPGGYDFVDVRDVAGGVLAACRSGRAGNSYILSASYVPMLDLVNIVCRLSGQRPIRVVLPLWLAAGAAPVCELWYRARKQVPLFTPYSVATVGVNALFSHEKAERELGYSPRPIEATLVDMLAWMRTQPDWKD